MKIDLTPYQKYLKQAIEHFWATRNQQIIRQKEGQRTDQGNRGAVTGGKQLDGFIELLAMAARDIGIPKEYIFLKGTHLPGYFRPTKEWDFLIIAPNNKLIAVAEFKSQVGSFGNNFNNRTEEALGSAVDLWTAFREAAFPNQQAPWLGYLMVLERTEKSTSEVRLNSSHYPVFPDFENTSYLDRYQIFCRKMMLERHYTAAALVWTSQDGAHGNVSEDISFENFLLSFLGYLQGKLNEFETKA